MNKETREYLAIKDLKNGYIYKIKGIYANYGVWDESEKAFIVSRWKFKSNNLALEYHLDSEVESDFATMFEDQDVRKIFGTTKPIGILKKFEFELKEISKYNDRETKEILIYLDSLDNSLKNVIHKSWDEIQKDRKQ